MKSEPSRRGNARIKAMHTLERPVRVGNRDLIARTVVQEDQNGKLHYDLYSKGATAPVAK